MLSRIFIQVEFIIVFVDSRSGTCLANKNPKCLKKSPGKMFYFKCRMVMLINCFEVVYKLGQWLEIGTRLVPT